MTSNIISVDTIREKTVPILKNYPVNKAILFGSYAKGNAIIGSDIDLIDRSHIEPDSLIMQEIENGGMVIYEKSKDYSKDN